MATTFPTSSRHWRASRRMLYLIEQYRKAHPDDGLELDPYLVADWAITQGLYRPPRPDPKRVLRQSIRRALRDDYIEDPQGRDVRANHPVMLPVPTAEGVQWRSVWYRLFEMPPDKLRASGQLRRRGALHDVLQIHLDFESYNDNNVLGAKVDMLDFDFNKDIEESLLPTEYPDAPTLEDEESSDEGEADEDGQDEQDEQP